MNCEALVRQVASVAHLKLLDLGDQMPALAGEVMNAFTGVGESRLAPFSYDNFNLQVSGILDYGDDPLTSGLYLEHLAPEIRKNGIQPTRVGKQTPRLLELISTITDFKGRVRLSRLPAGQSVPLHNHKYLEFILHLPLVTHPDVQMSAVIGDTDERRHYRSGELWHFNAFHRHAVYNRSPVDRYHVWCGFPIKLGDRYNRKLLALMEAALAGSN